MKHIAPTNVPFADRYQQPLTFDVFYAGEKATPQQIQQWGYEKQPCSYYPSTVTVLAQFYFQVTDEDRPQLLVLRNFRLAEYIKTNGVQRIPALSVPQAVEQAKRYCDALGYPLPSTNMVLERVTFDKGGSHCWSVRWVPEVSGYRHDNFVTPYEQATGVVFHEKHGFVSYECQNDFPVPKRMDVLVRQEAAIAKASKAVPLIQRSPYYLQCRLPGFVVSGLRSAELLVAAPNWLLDPKRAIWLRDKPPDETRLCWVITFTSVYTGKTE
ncbi:MAG: hypothetical protein FWG50_14080, partial [Kiritimatiellaeota bacterium]|nr:hypothetical protein [Kiritimatiellota bacterium]